MSRVRAFVWHRVDEENWQDAASAYNEISTALQGTPGLLGNELLRSVTDPQRFIVMSEWENFQKFSDWEQGVDHRKVTSPLRRFQDREREPHFELVTVEASF